MFIRLEPNASEPLYQQLARQLRQQIAGGEWKAGEQLPSARELSAELEINFLTVNKVYQMLEHEGLVEVRRGMGTFVATRSAEAVEQARQALFADLVTRLISGARSLGMTDDEILKRIQETTGDRKHK